MIRNVNDLIKNGMLTEAGEDYKAADGRTFKRIHVGRRGSTTMWLCEEDGYAYRSLFEAYNRSEFGGCPCSVKLTEDSSRYFTRTR